jgi:CBS domain-containing protein
VSSEEFSVKYFARKPVQRLGEGATLLDAIELMADLNIRHVPVVNGVNLMGVVNSFSVMQALLNYTDASTLKIPITKLLSQDFITVTEDESFLEILTKIGENDAAFAVLLMDDYIFQGIYTEADILASDYLWTELNDHTISSATTLGVAISDFSCASSDATIRQAMECMLRIKSEIAGLFDTSGIFVGCLSVMDIVRYLVEHVKDGETSNDIFEVPLSSIPTSGLYVKEPLTLHDMRDEMVDNSTYLTILLNEDNYPVRLISLHDIIGDYLGHTRLPLK